MSKTSIELLSPARNLECGIAAIDHGADAVYIGAPRFGARAAACNTVDDIARLCQYAHPFGVRIYATLNTILYDSELDEAEQLVWELYRAGVDALIVQDMALHEMHLPPIALHASTQMDNRTPEQVAWLASLGYEQVVLARELSTSEIRRIHEAVPTVQLEAFVHGALCVSLSGRCYASQSCFGRSANRGECAQFCRLPFTLEDGEGHVLSAGKHLLSLRDMNRSQHLEEMMDAGVSSFKIEGRLKDVSYVKNITAYYRRQIDAILRRRTEYVRSSRGTNRFSFTPDPERSFSRGFTDYFLHGRTPHMSSPDTARVACTASASTVPRVTISSRPRCPPSNAAPRSAATTTSSGRHAWPAPPPSAGYPCAGRSPTPTRASRSRQRPKAAPPSAWTSPWNTSRHAPTRPRPSPRPSPAWVTRCSRPPTSISASPHRGLSPAAHWPNGGDR